MSIVESALERISEQYKNSHGIYDTARMIEVNKGYHELAELEVAIDQILSESSYVTNYIIQNRSMVRQPCSDYGRERILGYISVAWTEIDHSIYMKIYEWEA